MACDQSTDKLTGKKLIPIQVWVEPEVHIILADKAARKGWSLKYMLRGALTKIANKRD